MSKTHTAWTALKDPKMASVKKFKGKTNCLIYVQNNEWRKKIYSN